MAGLIQPSREWVRSVLFGAPGFEHGAGVRERAENLIPQAADEGLGDLVVVRPSQDDVRRELGAVIAHALPYASCGSSSGAFVRARPQFVLDQFNRATSASVFTYNTEPEVRHDGSCARQVP